MTFCIAAALVTCIVCALGRITIVLWFGLCIWVVCAAGAGAVVGAVFGQVAAGAIVATGGALCCIRFMSLLFSSEHRGLQGATASADLRLKLEASLINVKATVPANVNAAGLVNANATALTNVNAAALANVNTVALTHIAAPQHQLA